MTELNLTTSRIKFSIGAMRNKIVIQKPITIDDGYGGETESNWQTVADIWAQKFELSEAERFMTKQLQVSHATIFVTRFRDDVERDYRVWLKDNVQGERLFTVNTIREDESNRRRWTVLLCEEITPSSIS